MEFVLILDLIEYSTHNAINNKHEKSNMHFFFNSFIPNMGPIFFKQYDRIYFGNKCVCYVNISSQFRSCYYKRIRMF